MRLAPALGLLCVVPVGLLAQQPGAGYAPSLPSAVGDVSRWEVVTGDFDAPKRMRGSYRFYVNPARLAMYQLMRYRVQLLNPAGDGGRGSAERVAFVRHPGAREPMLIWVREAPEAWRALVANTDEYRIEIGVVMGVLAVHRSARAGENP
jgi:hypothetical protein